ncbi:hypothetical protein B0H19DRAFT_58490 [Mycena capillaripes]|nr:hypothetical protein B0H19DRAFT_58490 [Mycena capillaripes]
MRVSVANRTALVSIWAPAFPHANFGLGQSLDKCPRPPQLKHRPLLETSTAETLTGSFCCCFCGCSISARPPDSRVGLSPSLASLSSSFVIARRFFSSIFNKTSASEAPLITWSQVDTSGSSNLRQAYRVAEDRQPFIPAAHPRAATYIIAERAADIIGKANE